MMEHRWITARKAGQKKSQIIFTDDATGKVTLEYSQSKSSSTCPQSQLSLSINKDHELVPCHYRFSCRISKQITSFDEQYLSHCLELIKISAAKAASFNFSVTWNQLNIASLDGILLDEFRNNSLKNRVTSSETRSKSLILHANDDISSDVTGLASIKGSLDSFNGSLGGFTMCSSPMVPSSSDLSSCVWPLISHGTLQCTWRNGIPHFTFSLDNKREVYVTRLTKSVSSGSSSSNLNWAYIIYSRTGTRKELEFCGSESNLVGRMNVSARCRKCDEESKIVETEFILYGDNDERERENLSYDVGKHKRLSGKVSKLFKPLHLPKHRPSNSTWGTSTSLDLSLSKPEQDEDYDSDHIGRPSLLDKIPSNFELAAIFVKEHIQAPETEVGGWGLSFLKRAREKQPTRDFSTHTVKVESSMDIILPAGYHGGPKIGNSGPSSLIERWRSGGQCDCGGWDTGCPLTVLNTRLHNKLSDPHSQRHCVNKFESLDLFLKGDERQRHATSMKMVNIQNGLYYIDFQSRLSPLQCFSIAVAIIHSRSPSLRPEAQTS